jgi:hypothetical protein
VPFVRPETVVENVEPLTVTTVEPGVASTR